MLDEGVDIAQGVDDSYRRQTDGLPRERSAISSANIGREDDQPILTRSLTAGFVTGPFDR